MTDKERIELRIPTIMQLMNQAKLDIDHIGFVSGGRTNESYVVYTPDGCKYLARIAGAGTECFIDRSKEIHNVVTADHIGVAPKLICADNNNLLLEYIDGECTTSQEILFLDGNTDKITSQLKRLHDSGEQFKGKFSFIHDYLVYKNDFLTTGYPIPPEMKQNEQELYEITRWVDERVSNDVCPVHSDIVLQNFILTKDRAYLVDWEYSTMADRYLDLASFCTQNILGPGAEKMFLKSYFNGSDTQMDYGKFLLFKMSISFMWVYWHLNNVAHNKDSKYNEYRWRMHLNNAIVCKEEWEQQQKVPSGWR